jgi:hypothetical protein
VTYFNKTASGNTVAIGTFPTGALTFSLAAGSTLTVQFSVAVPANTPRGFVFNNFVGVTLGSTLLLSNVATVKFHLPEQGEPADVVVGCHITPDREASDDEDNEIKFSCNLSNIGFGKAKAFRLIIPIDINLVVAYALFDHPGVWVSSIVLTGDQPYLVISAPDMESEDEMLSTIVFHPKPGKSLKGTKISLQAVSGWDDDGGAGKNGKSNTAFVTFGSSNVNVSNGSTLQFDQGTVTTVAQQKITYTTNAFEPDEGVATWLSKPDNTNLVLVHLRADHDGKILYIFDTTGLAPGSYLLVAYGERTKIQIISIIIIIVTSGTTSTASPTVTSTTTITPSPTVTTTLTVSPTVTSTGTVTVTVTPSPTVTTTLTVSPTVTGTSTITPSPTVTTTSTVTVTMQAVLPKQH